MAVEFTASVRTFCGGAVGTVASPRTAEGVARGAGAGGAEGRERGTLSCVGFTAHHGAENPHVRGMLLEADSGVS